MTNYMSHAEIIKAAQEVTEVTEAKTNNNDITPAQIGRNIIECGLEVRVCDDGTINRYKDGFIFAVINDGKYGSEIESMIKSVMPDAIVKTPFVSWNHVTVYLS